MHVLFEHPKPLITRGLKALHIRQKLALVILQIQCGIIFLAFAAFKSTTAPSRSFRMAIFVSQLKHRYQYILESHTFVQSQTLANTSSTSIRIFVYSFDLVTRAAPCEESVCAFRAKEKKENACNRQKLKYFEETCNYVSLNN